MPDVEREITIPATPDEVWPAVTESDELSSWFGAEVELEAQPGGRGVFRWPDGAERRVVVEDVERGRRLAFRWLPFQRTADGETVLGARFVVRLPAAPVHAAVFDAPLAAPIAQPATTPPLAMRRRWRASRRSTCRTATSCTNPISDWMRSP